MTRWLALAIGTVAGLAACGSVEPGRTPSASVLVPTAMLGATQAVGDWLDDVPGLGRSEASMARNDAIAYWEAWRRARVVQACMDRAGLDWALDVPFPEDAVVEVAKTLNVAVTAPAPTGQSPGRRNDATLADLDGDGRDRWFRALYGESAADIEAAGEHRPSGSARLGADDFAQGGCKGESDAAVESVGDLEESLSDDLGRLQTESRSTPAFATALRRFTECARQHGLDGVSGPADLEGHETSPEMVDAVSAVSAACSIYWDQANDAGMAEVAPAFIAAHAVEIKAQQRRYRGWYEVIRGDTEFVEHLAEAAARWRDRA